MVCYYDSSVMLSAVLEEKRDYDYTLLWDNVSTRLSSNLLKIECIIGVRRAGLMQGLDPDNEWVTQRIDILEQYFNGIYFKLIDDSIEKTIRKCTALADCRSLDAIHLATALYFKPHLEEPVFISSLDKRMRAVASKLGFKLFPEDSHNPLPE